MKSILDKYLESEKLLQQETIRQIVYMPKDSSFDKSLEELKSSSIKKLLDLRELTATEIVGLLNKITEIVSKDNLATSNIQACLDDLYSGYGSAKDAIDVFHNIFNASPNFMGKNQDTVIKATEYANSLSLKRPKGRPKSFPFLLQNAKREIDQLKLSNKVYNPSQNDETIFHEAARRLSEIGLRLTENQIWKWYSNKFHS